MRFWPVFSSSKKTNSRSVWLQLFVWVSHLSVESDQDLLAFRWASGEPPLLLEAPLLFGGRDHHTIGTRTSPDFRQEILAGYMMEDQFGARLALMLAPDQRQRARACLTVPDLDCAHASGGDYIGAGWKLRRAYTEGERHISFGSRLSLGRGVEHQRHHHQRQDPDQVAFHNILLGAPRSGTQTEFVIQARLRYRWKLAVTDRDIACVVPSPIELRSRSFCCFCNHISPVPSPEFSAGGAK